MNPQCSKYSHSINPDPDHPTLRSHEYLEVLKKIKASHCLHSTHITRRFIERSLPVCPNASWQTSPGSASGAKRRGVEAGMSPGSALRLHKPCQRLTPERGVYPCCMTFPVGLDQERRVVPVPAHNAQCRRPASTAL